MLRQSSRASIVYHIVCGLSTFCRRCRVLSFESPIIQNVCFVYLAIACPIQANCTKQFYFVLIGIKVGSGSAFGNAGPIRPKSAAAAGLGEVQCFLGWLQSLSAFPPSGGRRGEKSGRRSGQDTRPARRKACEKAARKRRVPRLAGRTQAQHWRTAPPRRGRQGGKLAARARFDPGARVR